MIFSQRYDIILLQKYPEPETNGVVFLSLCMKDLQKVRKEDEDMDDAKIVELYFERSEEAIAQTRSKYEKYCLEIAKCTFDR